MSVLDPADARRPRLVRPLGLARRPFRAPLGVGSRSLTRTASSGLRFGQGAFRRLARRFRVFEFVLTLFEFALPRLNLALARRDLRFAAQDVRCAPALPPAGERAGGQNKLAGPRHDSVPAPRDGRGAQGVVQSLADEDAAQQDL